MDDSVVLDSVKKDQEDLNNEFNSIIGKVNNFAICLESISTVPLTKELENCYIIAREMKPNTTVVDNKLVKEIGAFIMNLCNHVKENASNKSARQSSSHINSRSSIFEMEEL